MPNLSSLARGVSGLTPSGPPRRGDRKCVLFPAAPAAISDRMILTEERDKNPVKSIVDARCVRIDDQGDL